MNLISAKTLRDLRTTSYLISDKIQSHKKLEDRDFSSEPSHHCAIWKNLNCSHANQPVKYDVLPYWSLPRIFLCCLLFMSIAKIDLEHKSHNTPITYPTMHYFVTEMCTFLLQKGASWDICLVHCAICNMGLLKIGNTYILVGIRSPNEQLNVQSCFFETLWDIKKSRFIEAWLW